MHFPSVPYKLFLLGSSLEKGKSLWTALQSIRAMGLTGNSDFQEAHTTPVFPNLRLRQSPAQPGPCPTSNFHSLPFSCSAPPWPTLNSQKSVPLPTIGTLHMPFPGVYSILLQLVNLPFRSIIGERVGKGCERSNRASVEEAVAGPQRELTRL